MGCSLVSIAMRSRKKLRIDKAKLIDKLTGGTSIFYCVGTHAGTSLYVALLVYKGCPTYRTTGPNHASMNQANWSELNEMSVGFSAR